MTPSLPSRMTRRSIICTAGLAPSVRKMSSALAGAPSRVEMKRATCSRTKSMPAGQARARASEAVRTAGGACRHAPWLLLYAPVPPGMCSTSSVARWMAERENILPTSGCFSRCGQLHSASTSRNTVMGFCPSDCGLPMLHSTILSNGSAPGVVRRVFASCMERSTISPRTAYSAWHGQSSHVGVRDADEAHAAGAALHLDHLGIHVGAVQHPGCTRTHVRETRDTPQAGQRTDREGTQAGRGDQRNAGDVSHSWQHQQVRGAWRASGIPRISVTCVCVCVASTPAAAGGHDWLDKCAMHQSLNCSAAIGRC